MVDRPAPLPVSRLPYWVAVANLYVLALFAHAARLRGWAILLSLVPLGAAYAVYEVELAPATTARRFFIARTSLVGALVIAVCTDRLPPWSWLIVAGSAIAAMIATAYTPNEPGATVIHTGPAIPPRWVRRAGLVRALAVATFAFGMLLLTASNVAETSFGEHGERASVLLVAATGLLGLFAARQFFVAPVLDHIGDDATLRAELDAKRRVSTTRRLLRMATWATVAAVAYLLGAK